MRQSVHCCHVCQQYRSPMPDRRLPVDPYRRLPPAEPPTTRRRPFVTLAAFPLFLRVPHRLVRQETGGAPMTDSPWAFRNEQGERVTLRWPGPTSGHERRRRNQQQAEAARELGKLWCSPLPANGRPRPCLSTPATLAGTRRTGDVHDAVHPLPWLGSASSRGASGVGSVAGGSLISAHNVALGRREANSELPGELERWRRLDPAAGRASGTFDGIFQRAADLAEPG